MKREFIAAEGQYRFTMMAGWAGQTAMAIVLIGVMSLLAGHPARAQDAQPQDRAQADFSELLKRHGWHQETDAEGNMILYRTRQPELQSESPKPESPKPESVQASANPPESTRPESAQESANPAEGMRRIELLRLIGRLRQEGWQVLEDGTGGLLLTPPGSDAPEAPASPQTVALPDKDADGVIDEVDLCPDTDTAQSVGPLGCPADQPLQLEGVHFYSASSRLRTTARKALDEVAAILRRQPDAEVTVLGHTDSVGGAEANMKLSLRRAKAVRDYLVGQGVEARRVTAEGRGETQPVADNSTPQGRLKNRRVELLIRTVN